MKIAILLIAILVTSIATIIQVYPESDSNPSKKLPRDEPNFKPKITQEKINGKSVEVIEFKSKILK